MGTKDASSLLSQLLNLRLLVGFLGERAQFDWWHTAFYEPSARPFLEPIFAKNSGLAQYHGVVEAARRLHDEHLSVGAFHLFRLPEEVEQDLHALAQAGVSLSSAPIANKDAASEALGKLSGGLTEAAIGPLSVGSIQDVLSSALNMKIAQAYHSAFSSGNRAFPYLVK